MTTTECRRLHKDSRSGLNEGFKVILGTSFATAPVQPESRRVYSTTFGIESPMSTRIFNGATPKEGSTDVVVVGSVSQALGSLREVLRTARYNPLVLEDNDAAPSRTLLREPAAVVLDLAAPRAMAFATRFLLAAGPFARPPILVVGEPLPNKALVSLRDAGIAAYVERPYVPSGLLCKIARSLGRGYLRSIFDRRRWVGDRVGPYFVGEELGRGGMGVVYRALDTRSDTEVAIKVLPPDADLVEFIRFRREIEVLRTVEHPDLTRFRESGRSNDLNWCTMEYVSGRSLWESDFSGVAMAESRVRDIAGVLAGALQHIHERGLLHLDIKPGNILLRPSGRPVLADFGLARYLLNNDLDIEGELVGTPEYMAPEQLQGEELDARADLFSLGQVLIELLTGRPAVKREGTSLMVSRICLGDFPRGRDIPGISASLATIIDRLTAVDRRERYASAAELACALAACVADAAA